MATSSQSVSHPPCTIHQPSECQHQGVAIAKIEVAEAQRRIARMSNWFPFVVPNRMCVRFTHTHTHTRTSPANLLSIQIRKGWLETDRVDNKCPTEVKIYKSRWAPHGNAFCDVRYLSEGGGRIGVDYIDVSEPLLALLVHLPASTCALASTEMCFLFGVSLLFLCNQSGKIY